MSHLRHGRLHRMRGWGLIRARGARLSQRRYMRLTHYTLEVLDSSDPDVALLVLSDVLVGASVAVNRRRLEIVVKFATDRFYVQLNTMREFQAWATAFRDAARVVNRYYKVVKERELGRGAFSTVYFGFDVETGDPFAIKVADKRHCTEEEKLCAETEARMMGYVRHPAIVQCVDIFDAPESMHVVMEWMTARTLEERMAEAPAPEKIFTERGCATIMSHVLSALAYLEKEGICHRDIKPDNILLSTPHADRHWETTAKLSDFGFARFIETDVDLIGVAGTLTYVAPEVISRDPIDDQPLGYGTPVDVWAAGIMMYWMFTGGEFPFDGPDNGTLLKAIRAAVLDLEDGIWETVSDEAKELLRALLCPAPATRLRASAACVHPWLLNAYDTPPPARWARKYENAEKRRAKMNFRSLFRAAVSAVRATIRFLELVDEDAERRRRVIRSEWLKNFGRTKKMSAGERMQRAPELAPVGADGLGYNVGIIPSFAPKRRARAGVSPQPVKRGEGGGDRVRSMRISRESGSSGSRLSGERNGSIDRSFVGGRSPGKSNSWGLRLRGKSSEK